MFIVYVVIYVLDVYYCDNVVSANKIMDWLVD